LDGGAGAGTGIEPGGDWRWGQALEGQHEGAVFGVIDQGQVSGFGGCGGEEAEGLRTGGPGPQALNI
jgi:hypothetical protein